MKKPLVSICIPSYNRRELLKQAIASALAQTYKNIEIIISDNCTPDPELERYCRTLAKQHDHVKYFRQNSNIGGLANIQFVISEARGEYTCLLADDDYFAPQYVEKLILKLMESPSAIAACSNIIFIDETGKSIDLGTKYPFYNNLQLNSPCKIQDLLRFSEQYGWYNFYMCIKSSYLKQSNIFYKQSWGSDYLWAMQVILDGNIVKVDEDLFYYKMQEAKCIDRHLNENFNKFSQIHPFADQLYNAFCIVFQSSSISFFSKTKFFVLFWKKVIQNESPWVFRLNEFSLFQFFKKLLLARQYFASIILLPALFLPIKRKLTPLYRHIKSYCTLRALNIPQNTIALIEQNICHAECLIGLAEYLIQLGYRVDIIISHEIMAEQPFTRYKSKSIRIISLQYKDIIRLLRMKKAHYYDGILLATLYDYRKNKIFLGAYCFPQKTLNKMCVISHNLSELDELRSYFSGPVGVLSSFGTNTPVVNPHYFGKITNPTPLISHRFVVPGINGKNLLNVISAVQHLLDNNYTNFSVVLIGNISKSDNPDIYEKLNTCRHNVKLLGRIPFPQLYSEIEKADFLISLLDCKDNVSKRFLSASTTGAKQISLGFSKPLLIQKPFAEAYSFTNKNAIIYENEKLANAMIFALSMKMDDYAEMCLQIKILSNKIKAISLNNLKKFFLPKGHI